MGFVSKGEVKAGQKPHLNLAFIGHVDHGKSTIVGRVLYETGVISDHDLKDEAGSFKFAWVLDKLREERERGVTIDLTHVKFETDKYYYTIVDCPGHRDFVKNMITGTSQADVALLVVAADDGVMPQTREHAFLARTLGVNQLIVSINKMDLVKWDENRYKEVKGDTEKLLKSIGFKTEQIPFIPMAALVSKENIIDSKSDWYDGPTLIEALDAVTPPEKPVHLPLRIPVQDVYSITGVGTVPVGRVETGVLKVGDKVVFQPAGVSGEVKSIEMHHESIPKAEPGDNIGFNVRGIAKKDIRRGDVCGHEDNPPTVVKEFTAQIVVLQHPSAIAPGYTPVFHAHTAQVACRFDQLLKKIDPKTGAVVEENPAYLKTGDAAIVKIVPTKPMSIEKASDIPHMGRFAVRDMGQTVAAGIVIDVVPK